MQIFMRSHAATPAPDMDMKRGEERDGEGDEDRNEGDERALGCAAAHPSA